MKKVLKTFSIVVISLFTLSIFGWMVSHITEGDKNYGFLTEPVKYIVAFPDLFSQSVEEVKRPPKTFIVTPKDFKPINKLNSDVIVLASYSDTTRLRSIVLLNLRNDSILYKWTVKNPYKVHKRIENPLLFPKKSLVFSFHDKPSLRRIDSLSHVIWKQDSIFPHHSMNPDKNGDIWLCTHQPVYYATGMYKLNGRSVFYNDDYITKVDAETGRIMFHKSVTEILRENNLSSYILKSSNIKDPYHINDVEPALKSTRYYRQGDLFISSRNLSIIMHYRPSTNKVIKIIEGPFTSQHDVDLLNDSTLVIFNNNFYNLGILGSKEPPKDSSRLEFAGDFYSNIVRYDFCNDSLSFIGDSIFRENNIFTGTEGLVDFIDPSTYFVEEQNSGLLWIIKNNQVIYKNVLASQHKGYHHLPNWTRIIKHDE